MESGGCNGDVITATLEWPVALGWRRKVSPDRVRSVYRASKSSITVVIIVVVVVTIGVLSAGRWSWRVDGTQGVRHLVAGELDGPRQCVSRPRQTNGLWGRRNT